MTHPERPLLTGAVNQRWMCFVDGENLTIRGQQFAEAHNLRLVDGPSFRRDVFLWLPPNLTPLSVMRYGSPSGRSFPLPDAYRAYYYTSAVGDDELLAVVREELWTLGFHPEVFKKTRGSQKTKGVDITMARDLLTHAFHNNYDVACLIAGDGDYVPLVRELKHLGKAVCICFFADGLSTELRREADAYYSLDLAFENAWRSHVTTA